jgi:tRNA-dihydrouridine synthase B
MLETTGVDAVWIARGAIGNPWIFQHAKMLLEEQKTNRDTGFQPVTTTDETSTGRRPVSRLNPPRIHEQREALAEHFGIAMQIHGESLAGRRMRKMGIKYSRFHPNSTEVKRDFINVHSLRDWTGVLDRWYATDGPGVWPAADAADEVNAEETSCAM